MNIYYDSSFNIIKLNNNSINDNIDYFLFSTKKLDYLNNFEEHNYYVYSYENNNIVSGLAFDNDIHITGNKMFVIFEYKCDDFNKIINLINFVENIAAIRNITFVQFEINIEKHLQLFNYLKSHKYRQVFKDSGFLRKYIRNKLKII